MFTKHLHPLLFKIQDFNPTLKGKYVHVCFFSYKKALRHVQSLEVLISLPDYFRLQLQVLLHIIYRGLPVPVHVWGGVSTISQNVSP